MTSNFNNAQNFQIDNYQFVNVNPSADPLSSESGSVLWLSVSIDPYHVMQSFRLKSQQVRFTTPGSAAML
ncbi:hypothetical protein EST38_g12419 [Candolleomyces aberdarensis]|uniref:Uncharacterized protein n=1 Tax=Candolleomyces aberdarensis TaxID=2316362 RepID=A0A4V1Q208_9AGAR|nr:hypothetical protein EST38_g12419 [Candolleomyces aberdarensis]